MATQHKDHYDIRVRPDQLEDVWVIAQKLSHLVGERIDLEDYELVRRSIDARKKTIYYQLRFRLKRTKPKSQLPTQKIAANAPEVVIVGSGPAGLFAALQLLKQGIRPIILERGKDVQSRRRDLRAIQQEGVVDPDSNYCFGEGGAGTYSDGKLYTRSKKRGSVAQVLNILVEQGAPRDILIDAHPHIGSNKLPKVVANIRATIIGLGGEIRFGHRVVDLEIRDGAIQGVVLNDGTYISADRVILATGHSARDIYYMLERKLIRLESKAFAIGVRVEHPQALIDEIQYKQKPRHSKLPPASYQLTCQVAQRGVFSFCMCPGGLVVPAATAPGEIVVNGMSLSRRDSAFANSGIVAEIAVDDLEQKDLMAGIRFQQSLEQRCFAWGDGSQQAPAQRLTDFVRGVLSKHLPESSYIPGLFSAPVDQLFSDNIYHRLCAGLMEFGRRLPGYLTSEAVVIGTESRTSSPIRIPRNRETLMHEDVHGLYPCGEGAGYAGGIVSAAMDGMKVAQVIASELE